jgi:hypothetical protein
VRSMDEVVSHLLLESISKSTAGIWVIIGEVSLLLASVAVVVGLYGESKADKWSPAPSRVTLWHKIFVALVTLGVAGELLADGDIFLFSHRLQTIQDLEVARLTLAAEQLRADNLETEKILQPREFPVYGRNNDAAPIMKQLEEFAGTKVWVLQAVLILKSAD